MITLQDLKPIVPPELRERVKAKDPGAREEIKELLSAANTTTEDLLASGVSLREVTREFGSGRNDIKVGDQHTHFGGQFQKVQATASWHSPYVDTSYTAYVGGERLRHRHYVEQILKKPLSDPDRQKMIRAIARTSKGKRDLDASLKAKGLDTPQPDQQGKVGTLQQTAQTRGKQSTDWIQAESIDQMNMENLKTYMDRLKENDPIQVRTLKSLPDTERRQALKDLYTQDRTMVQKLGELAQAGKSPWQDQEVYHWAYRRGMIGKADVDMLKEIGKILGSTAQGFIPAVWSLGKDLTGAVTGNENWRDPEAQAYMGLLNDDYSLLAQGAKHLMRGKDKWKEPTLDTKEADQLLNHEIEAQRQFLMAGLENMNRWRAVSAQLSDDQNKKIQDVQNELLALTFVGDPTNFVDAVLAPVTGGGTLILKKGGQITARAFAKVAPKAALKSSFRRLSNAQAKLLSLGPNASAKALDKAAKELDDAQMALALAESRVLARSGLEAVDTVEKAALGGSLKGTGLRRKLISSAANLTGRGLNKSGELIEAAGNKIHKHPFLSSVAIGGAGYAAGQKIGEGDPTTTMILTGLGLTGGGLASAYGTRLKKVGNFTRAAGSDMQALGAGVRMGDTYLPLHKLLLQDYAGMPSVSKGTRKVLQMYDRLLYSKPFVAPESLRGIPKALLKPIAVGGANLVKKTVGGAAKAVTGRQIIPAAATQAGIGYVGSGGEVEGAIMGAGMAVPFTGMIAGGYSFVGGLGQVVGIKKPRDMDSVASAQVRLLQQIHPKKDNRRGWETASAIDTQNNRIFDGEEISFGEWFHDLDANDQKLVALQTMRHPNHEIRVIRDGSIDAPAFYHPPTQTTFINMRHRNWEKRASGRAALTEFILAHEIGHFVGHHEGMDQSVFNAFLGNPAAGVRPRKGSPWIALDNEGNPIIRDRDGNLVTPEDATLPGPDGRIRTDLHYEVSADFKARLYDYVSRIGLEWVDSRIGDNRSNALQSAMDDADFMKAVFEDQDPAALDELLDLISYHPDILREITREIFAESYSKMLMSPESLQIQDGLDLANETFRRIIATVIGRVGGYFDEKGRIQSYLFPDLPEFRGVHDLVKEYNYRINRGEKIDISDDDVGSFTITPDDYNDAPEVLDLFEGSSSIEWEPVPGKPGEVQPKRDPKTGKIKIVSPANQKKKNELLQKAIWDWYLNNPDADPDPSAVQWRTNADGRKVLAGRFLPENLLEVLERDNRFNEYQIQNLRRVNNLLRQQSGGEAMTVFYQAATGQDSSGKRSYKNLSGKWRTVIPHGIEISQKDNVLIRVIEPEKLLDRATTLAQRKEFRDIYGGNYHEVANDMLQWLNNISAGEPGANGIGEAKRNLFRTASGLGKVKSSMIDENGDPQRLDHNELRDDFEEISRRGGSYLMSFRIDRTNKVQAASANYPYRLDNPHGFNAYDRAARNLHPGVDDAHYLKLAEEDPLKNRSELFKMFMERAKAEGFTTEAWHGTDKGGFTVFDSSKSRKDNSFRFADSRGWASTYTPRNDDIDVGLSWKDIIADPDRFDVELEETYAIVDEDGDLVFLQDGYQSKEYWEEEVGLDNLDEGHRLETFYEVYHEGYNYGAYSKEGLKEPLSEIVNQREEPGIYNVLLNTDGFEVVDWEGRNWDDGGDTPYFDIDDLAREYELMGSPGVIVENIHDSGPHHGGVAEGTQYIILDNKRIKALEPVTYDDSGNVIPLSERFNLANEDIRYFPGLDDEHTKRAGFNFTAVSNRIPVLRDLYAKKDWAGIREINRALIAHGLADIPKKNYKITIQDIHGVWKGETEPTIRVEIEAKDEATLDQIRSRINALGAIFDQDEVHEFQLATVADGQSFGVVPGQKDQLQPYARIFVEDPSDPGRKLDWSELEPYRAQTDLLGASFDGNEIFIYAVDGDDVSFFNEVHKLEQLIHNGNRSRIQKTAEHGAIRLRRAARDLGGAETFRYEEGTLSDGTASKEGQDRGLQNDLALRILKFTGGRLLSPKDAKRSLFVGKDLTPNQLDRQVTIADNMEAAPVNDMARPIVKRAYKALQKELVDQYKAIVEGMEVIGVPYKRKQDGKWIEGDIYPNSKEAIRDIRQNNRMEFLLTDPDAFGPQGEDFSGHPLLEDSGIEVQLQNAETGELSPYSANYNDILRVVHDVIAHGLYADEFGPIGEEGAYRTHAVVTQDPLAIWALATETRAQNSWVNYGPQMRGADGKLLKPEDPGYLPIRDREFAEQKAILLPLDDLLTGVPEIDKKIENLREMLTPEEAMGSLAKASDSRHHPGVDDTRYLELAKDPEGNQGELRGILDQATKDAGLEGPFYHGSSSDGITEFEPGRAGYIYFTPQKEYANDYGSNITEAFLKFDNLADLTDPNSDAYKKAVEVFNRNGGWSLNPDAMEGRSSPEFNPKTDYTWELFDNPDTDIQAEMGEYDAWKLQERDGIISYAVADPSQIKSADPVTYDDSGNVIPLSERFNQRSNDIRYAPGIGQLKQEAFQAIELVDAKVAQRLIAESGVPKSVQGIVLAVTDNNSGKLVTKVPAKAHVSVKTTKKKKVDKEGNERIVTTRKVINKPTSWAVPALIMDKNKKRGIGKDVSLPEHVSTMKERSEGIREGVKADPEKAVSPNGFLELLRKSGIYGVLPPRPSTLETAVNNPQTILDWTLGKGLHGEKTIETRQNAIEGLDGTVEFRNLIGEGKAPDPYVSALLNLWGTLSKQLPPIEQESWWLRMISQRNILETIFDSIEGNYNLSKKQWEGMVELVAENTEGGKERGKNATSNANGFNLPLERLNGQWDRFADVFATTDAKEMRERFWNIVADVGPLGVKNKVMGFEGLTLNIPTWVGDRWQYVFTNIPDLVKLGGANTIQDYLSYNQFNVPEDPSGVYSVYGTIDSKSPMFSNLFYEYINSVIQSAIDAHPKQYREMLGDHMNASGFHWVTWNAIKNEPVGHSSLSLLFDLQKAVKDGEVKTRDQYIEKILSGDTYTEGKIGGQDVQLHFNKGQISLK